VRKPDNSSSPPSQEEHSPTVERVSILLAMQDGILASGLQALFASSDEFEIIGMASSGREALSMCRILRPSLIVLDVALSEFSASEIVRRLCAESQGGKILALSSASHWGSVVGLFRVGAWGFIARERPVDDLKAALRSIAQGHRFVDGLTGGMLAHAWSEARGATSEVALASLSKREGEIFQMLIQGRSATEIGKSLFISRKTVETHRRVILRKLRMRNIAGLMDFAARNRLLSP
jgi:two-component system response regulator NreC